MVNRKYEHISQLSEGVYQIRFAYRDPAGNTKRMKRRVTGTLEDAVLERERLLALAQAGMLEGDKGRNAVVGDYVEEYLTHLKTRRKPATQATIENFKSSWRNRIEPTCGQWVPMDIRRADLLNLIKDWEKLKKEDDTYYAAKSIKTWRDALTPFLSWIFEQIAREDVHILRRLPIVQSDPNARKGRALSPEEGKKLLDYLFEHRPFWYTFVYLSLITGQRFGSVSALRWVDVDRDKIRFIESQYRGSRKVGSKTGKILTLPMTPALWGVLEAHRDYLEAIQHPNLDLGLVFPGMADGVQRGHLTSDKLRMVLTRACKQIGIEKVAPHDLRRTANTWMVDGGVSPSLVRAIVGHSSAQLTDHYYRGSDAVTLTALGAVEGMLRKGE